MTFTLYDSVPEHGSPDIALPAGHAGGRAAVLWEETGEMLWSTNID